jgi:zinc and cadmium transporter
MSATVASLLGVFLVSSASLVGLFFLALKEATLRRSMPLLISLAVGALLGDVFIHLLPELFEEEVGNTRAVSAVVFGGILLFFLLEKALHWHHHGEDSEAPHPVGKLVLLSDAIHNVLDGMMIAGSFLVSFPAGVATVLAVLLHEIPQEVGDFAVLLHAGYSKSRALLMNFLSALTAFVGAGVVLWSGQSVEGGSWVIPALAAGSFIYIAMADLIPELHKGEHRSRTFGSLSALLLGLAAMMALRFLE